jgi:galactose mutarotase-like enzyme
MTSEQPHPRVALDSGELSAEIDPQGAQLFTLRDRAARDLLWNGDAAVWSGRAPLLFPIVGTLAGGAYRLGSKTYRLPRHGFARNRTFTRESSDSSTALFSLRADEATLLVYPFRFELQIRFELHGPTLSLTACIRNHGEQAMPASFGFHPALRWPLPFGQPRSAHFIQFETDEPDPVRRIDADGLLTPQLYPTPVTGRRLALTDALFQDDVIIFDRLRSRSVIYGSSEGPRLQLNFADAPYFGLWSKPGAQFICIEPWHGITDAEGFTGELTDKAGVFVVAAGDSMSASMSITLLQG